MPIRAFFLTLAIALSAFSATAPAEIRAAAAKITEDTEAQPRLPTGSGTPEPSTRRNRPNGSLFGGDSFSVPAIPAVLSLVQWTVIAIAAVVLLTLLAIAFREPIAARISPPAFHGEPSLPEEAPADPAELLARADSLAALGQYAEAMHCVLLAAFAKVAPHHSSDSKTSWEILRSLTLSPAQHRALLDLVVRVERAWFGRRPADSNDYHLARGSFDSFSAPTTETA